MSKKKPPKDKTTGPAEGYHERSADALRKKVARKKLRDIEIDFSRQNKRRRSTGKRFPMFFLRTYMPNIFFMPFCDNQKHNIKEIVIRIKQGGMKAIAAERGGGKTSIMKGLVIWGLLYGYIHWVAWIEANPLMANDSLEDIKLMFDNKDVDHPFVQDFPEYCTPVSELEGQSLRARSMTYNGERIGMQWGSGRIIFPKTIAKKSGETEALGGIIQAFGAESRIRGLVRAGKRPDFVAINDIETEDTAKSITMTENIRKNLVNAVGGLAGPGQKIGMGMLCTIIQHGCIADMFTDRMQYPMWVGERMRLLISPPVNEQLWETYMHTRQTAQRAGDPDCRKAEKFYKKNRRAMDLGTKVANKLRFITTPGDDGKPLEISAIQHVYNLIADRGRPYFQTECQNDPPREESTSDIIKPHIICDKVNGEDRGVLPALTQRVTLFADVHDTRLYWAVMAWREGYVGYIVDYGVDRVFSPISGSVTKDEKVQQTELAIIAALKRLRQKSFWPDIDTGEMRGPDLALVDAGWKDMAVYTFVKTVQDGIWRPAKGGSSSTGPYRTPKKAKGIRKIGAGYHESFIEAKRIWLILHDANKWKKRVHEGFVIAHSDDPGSISLPGGDPVSHRAFAEQIVAEAYDTEKMRFLRVKGKRENHWLDCTAGCCLAAEKMGIRLLPQAFKAKPKTKPVAKRAGRRKAPGYLEGVGGLL